MKSWNIFKCNFNRIGSNSNKALFLNLKKIIYFTLKMKSQFGSEFDVDWPIKQPEYNNFGKKLLRKCYEIQKPIDSTVDEILQNSRDFSIPFPISTCRIEAQPDDRLPEIEKQINSAYPVIHERVLWLYLRFLEYKLKYGNDIEKAVYLDMNLSDFIQRLLSKRCAAFFGPNDKYLLINGRTGRSGFEPIGTSEEKFPLTLENCLSYDEMKLSALLSVSSHSDYINDGNRQNCGILLENKSLIEPSGIVIGVIGARLSRRYLMEYQDIMISKTQNNTKNGYGPKNFTLETENSEALRKLEYRKVWNEFYDEKDFIFTAVKKDGKRFGDSKKNKDDIFDNLIMRKRYAISFDTLLLESESRAAAANKQAYIHLVGFGLGVWRGSSQQDAIYMETFESRLKFLLPKLKHISYVHFSWFELESCGDLKNDAFYKSEEHLNGGIRVFVSTRNPADKLPSELENHLLVVSYAWDGNALPGNEFWMKMLKSTGDSSTACSTLITELHNPHINKTKVSGDNLHIASENGVLHIADYVKSLKI